MVKYFWDIFFLVAVLCGHILSLQMFPLLFHWNFCDYNTSVVYRHLNHFVFSSSTWLYIFLFPCALTLWCVVVFGWTAAKRWQPCERERLTYLLISPSFPPSLPCRHCSWLDRHTTILAVLDFGSNLFNMVANSHKPSNFSSKQSLKHVSENILGEKQALQ